MEVNDGVLTSEDSSDSTFSIEPEPITTSTQSSFYIPGYRIIEVLFTIFCLTGVNKLRKKI